MIGYLSIQVEGFYIERFINICKAKSILLWNMKREKSSVLNANIAIKDFKRIKDIVRKDKIQLTLSIAISNEGETDKDVYKSASAAMDVISHSVEKFFIC